MTSSSQFEIGGRVADKTCEACGEAWDTKQYGQCPTCQQLIRKDLESERARRIGFGRNAVDEDDRQFDFVEEVLTQAKNTRRRAGSLETLSGLLAVLGVIGGVVLVITGFDSDDSAGGLLIAIGLFNILIWLFVSALGLGIASRMKLAAAEARLRASQLEE